MKYRMFKQRFVEPIRAGSKRLTIRETAAGVNVGDMLSLRRWTGAPYRSKQEEIRPPVRVVAVHSIMLDTGSEWPLFVALDGLALNLHDLCRLAGHDGFSSAAQMADYWRDRLPFTGVAIRWEALP